MEILIHTAICLVGLIIGFIVHEIYLRFSQGRARRSARQIISEAKLLAYSLLKEAELKARDETLKRRETWEREFGKRKQELREMENFLMQKEEEVKEELQELHTQEKALEKWQGDLHHQEKVLHQRQEKLQELIERETLLLREASTLSSEEATERLLKRLEREVEQEAAQFIKTSNEIRQEKANEEAQRILLTAIQRCMIEYTMDAVVATIDLPSEEMKGRIIGRDGRNIRSFEKISGINVIVDDTPGVIVLSGFDPIRREVASIAMKRLIHDGRIHPARIEEVVEATSKEIDSIIEEIGHDALSETGISHLRPELITMVGKMKFFTIVGENLLQHTLTVAHLAGLLAAELRLDEKLAKRCALLHEIGRVADQFHEGDYAKVGADIAKRFHEPEEVVEAIHSHPSDRPSRSLYGVILQVAHTIALERPGSKKEALARHLKRMDQLEELALSFYEVEEAYILQSGKEIRCIISAADVDDRRVISLAREIAHKIAQSIPYSSGIRVSVERESRVVEYAH